MITELVTPLDPLHNDGYQWWSGLGSDVFLITGLAYGFRKINCHERRCWRVGKHHIEGTPYVVCHRHHPGLEGNKVQRGHIKAAHRKLQKGTP